MNQRTTIDTPDGSFEAWVAMPASTPAPAIVVVQEIFGINADLRATCRQLAEQGFIAICPDLFWRLQEGVELSDQSEGEWKQAMALYNAFDIDKGVEDIGATMNHARSYPGASGKVGVMGFCMGGLLTFLTSARQDPEAADLRRDRVDGRLVHVDDDDVGALGRQAQRRGLADASGTTGDDGGAVGEAVHVGSAFR